MTTVTSGAFLVDLGAEVIDLVGQDLHEPFEAIDLRDELLVLPSHLALAHHRVLELLLAGLHGEALLLLALTLARQSFLTAFETGLQVLLLAVAKYAQLDLVAWPPLLHERDQLAGRVDALPLETDDLVARLQTGLFGRAVTMDAGHQHPLLGPRTERDPQASRFALLLLSLLPLLLAELLLLKLRTLSRLLTTETLLVTVVLLPLILLRTELLLTELVLLATELLLSGLAELLLAIFDLVVILGLEHTTRRDGQAEDTQTVAKTFAHRKHPS